MRTKKSMLKIFFTIAMAAVMLTGTGCGYIYRAMEPIDTQQVNLDEPVKTTTLPDQVRSETVHFAHDGSAGTLVVTLTREAMMYDIQTDTVNRQVYQESGYGKDHKQWPVWVDAVTGSVLMIGGGTALALGASQDTENDIEYRTNPDTGQREQREVPNSSNQDVYYAAGGGGVGLSIPFIVSAIHNGVKTKDKKVGPPKRTDIKTEINQRTITVPLGSVPVTVTLPDGTTLDAQADADGRVNVALPDTLDAYFPLRHVAVVRVPSKEALYEIPAKEDTLALLPPTARAHADALADDVRSANSRYEVVSAKFDQAVAGPLSQVRQIQDGLYQYDIYGDIIETGENFIIIKGSAGCGYEREGSICDAYIAVFNYDRRLAAQTSYKHYQGRHHYRGKYFEKLYVLQSGPIMMYGDLPDKDRRVLSSAQAKLDAARAKVGPGLDNAKAAKDATWQAYITAMPSDPYGLNPAPKKEGK